MLARASVLSVIALLLLNLPAPHAIAAGKDAKQRIALKSGIQMAYREDGPKTGPPVILLHGLGDTGRSWSLPLHMLAQGHHLYILDLRGHGQSDAPACCYSFSDFAYDVIVFMDAKKIDRATIVGHSLGSFIAQHLAAAHPNRVNRLVLLGSSDTTVGTEFADWLWGKTEGFESGLPAPFLDEWVSNPTPVSQDFIAEVKKETEEVPVHVWKSVARVFLTENHSRSGEIKAPTLVLWERRTRYSRRFARNGSRRHCLKPCSRLILRSVTTCTGRSRTR